MLFGVFTLFLVFQCVKGNQFDSETRYECGAHGRFEYCIDGFPGCVIGCHCYPGYYFDTGTKICEPSTNLIKASRRFYDEPNEVTTQLPTFPTILTTTPIPTTTESEAKDLGDWLYNQFFKTIENQVVNNTSIKVETRRSGSWPGMRKKRTRAKKKRKKSKKKKKQDFRRESLRISPDDSIFDPTDNSDTSGSDSSSSASSSTGTDTSCSNSGGSSSSEHDQRDTKKLVIFNRRPKMPLPSFLFLPNMETPFFPPLGMPPALPMYPMVPVPPMVPPIMPPVLPPPYPPPGSRPPIFPPCDTSTAPVPTKPTTTSTASPIPPTITPNPTEPNWKKQKHRHKTRKQQEFNDSNEDDKPEVFAKRPRARLGAFGKMVRILSRQARQLKKEPRKLMPPDSNEDYDETLMNDVERPPGMDEVRFKYLSQLIHRPVSNVTRPPKYAAPAGSGLNIFHHAAVPKPVHMKRVLGKLSNFAAPPGLPSDTRRMNEGLAEEPSSPAPDKFYSDLGKQIAALIRKADSHGDREINVEVDDVAKAETVFNINNYPARSYWDRYVRSPVAYNNHLRAYAESKEMLYDLENKVFMASKDLPSLNLVQLENIAMRETTPGNRTEMEPQSTVPHSSDRSFNINLLPVSRRGFYQTLYAKPSTNAPVHHQKAATEKSSVNGNYVHITSLVPKNTAQTNSTHQKYVKPKSNSQHFLYTQKLHKPMQNGEVNGTIVRVVPIHLKQTQSRLNKIDQIRRELIRTTLQNPFTRGDGPKSYNYYQKRIIQSYNSPKRMNKRKFHEHLPNDRDARKYFEPAISYFQEPLNDFLES